jgi:hypothetical protein
MFKSRLTFASICLVTLFSLSRCVSPGGDSTGGAGTSGGGNTTGAAGTTGGGNTTGTAGSSGDAGTTGSSGNAGTTGSSGNAGTIGSSGNAGTTGTTGAAGTTATSGTAGTTAAAGRGGTTGAAGTTAAAGRGGTTGAAGTGAAGTAGVRKDQAGIPLAKPGDMTSVSKQYLNLGDMRLVNNRWGSDAKNCTSTMQRVFVNTDRSVGYDFTRGACDPMHANPDYPEIEFGVAPFGMTSSLLTTPAFSSTTLLPIQLSALTSASITVANFATTITSATPYWNSNFEFWISRRNPLTNADAGVYAEIIVFTGWQANRQSSSGGWPCMVSGTVPNTNYSICHQSDTWASGWRFFNFLAGPASGVGSTTVNGKIDIKAIIDWLRASQWGSGFTTDLWLTRLEIGTEVDENTKGSVRINNATFEINGQSRSIELQ